jgi:hypothetical protein
MKTPEQIRAEARALDRDAADFLRRQGFYNDANERVEAEAARQAETRRRRVEERRERRERMESAAVVELRAEIERLRELMAKGDLEIIDAINKAVFPALENIADKLQTTIKEIGQRVDRELNEIRAEIRAEIKRERSGEVLDLPPLRARNVN